MDPIEAVRRAQQLQAEIDYRPPPPPPVTGPHPWLTDGQYGQLLRNVHEALAAKEPIAVNDCVYAFDETEGQYVIRLRNPEDMPYEEFRRRVDP